MRSCLLLLVNALSRAQKVKQGNSFHGCRVGFWSIKLSWKKRGYRTEFYGSSELGRREGDFCPLFCSSDRSTLTRYSLLLMVGVPGRCNLVSAHILAKSEIYSLDLFISMIDLLEIYQIISSSRILVNLSRLGSFLFPLYNWLQPQKYGRGLPAKAAS